MQPAKLVKIQESTWDPLSRERKATLTPAKLSGFHRRGVSLLAFNQRGDQLASIGLMMTTQLHLRLEAKLLASGKGDKSNVACEYTPDGKTLVIVGLIHQVLHQEW